MNYKSILFIRMFTILVFVGAENYTFFPNLPSGKYKLFVKGIVHCNKNPNSNLQFNFRLNKKSINETELKGNATLKVSLDDSFMIRVKMSIKDSIGGWKNNAYNYQSKNAFKTLKTFFGTEWPIFAENFKMDAKNFVTHIPPGVYISNGYILSNLAAKGNFPRVFFYGTYQYCVDFIDSKGMQDGCINYIIEIKRPWETE